MGLKKSTCQETYIRDKHKGVKTTKQYQYKHEAIWLQLCKLVWRSLNYLESILPILGCWSLRQIRASRSNFWKSAIKFNENVLKIRIFWIFYFLKSKLHKNHNSPLNLKIFNLKKKKGKRGRCGRMYLEPRHLLQRIKGSRYRTRVDENAIFFFKPPPSS